MVLVICLCPDQDEPKRKGKRPRGGNSAFLAPIKLSDALMKFLGTGESALARSDVIKRIWDYIKLNNLQVQCDSDRTRQLYSNSPYSLFCRMCMEDKKKLAELNCCVK